jgi:hypothetical protein
MTDYAAAPVQPIVQGLLTVRGIEGFILSFFGIGIVQTGPFAPVRVGAGNYILTLDPGLPGDVAIDPPFGRQLLNVRSPMGTPTAVISKSIAYLTSPTLNPTQVGANQIQIRLANLTPVGVDPEVGLEIILWRADAGVELTNLNIIGPLFAPQGSAVP